MYIFLNGNKFDLTAHGITTSMVNYGSNIFITTRNNIIIRAGVNDHNGSSNISVDDGGPGYLTTTNDISSSVSDRTEYIIAGNDYLWVFDAKVSQYNDHSGRLITKMIKVDPNTLEVVATYKLPWEAHCKPELGGNKIWFTTVSTPANTTQKQKLFFYDLLTGAWTLGVDLQGPRQLSPRTIHHGGDQYVFINSVNGNSILKHNATNGAFVSEITINRNPQNMYTNGARELFVSSFAGMITKVNVTTDAVSNDHGALEQTQGMIDDDNGFLWVVQPNLIRIKKADNIDNHREMDGETLDTSIAAFSETTFKDILITKPFTHNSWNVNTQSISPVTEKSYICLLTNTSLFIATDFTDSWDMVEKRVYSVQVQGTGIVGTGPDKYFGEASL